MLTEISHRVGGDGSRHHRRRRAGGRLDRSRARSLLEDGIVARALTLRFLAVAASWVLFVTPRAGESRVSKMASSSKLRDRGVQASQPAAWNKLGKKKRYSRGSIEGEGERVISRFLGLSRRANSGAFVVHTSTRNKKVSRPLLRFTTTLHVQKLVKESCVQGVVRASAQAADW